MSVEIVTFAATLGHVLKFDHGFDQRKTFAFMALMAQIAALAVDKVRVRCGKWPRDHEVAIEAQNPGGGRKESRDHRDAAAGGEQACAAAFDGRTRLWPARGTLGEAATIRLRSVPARTAGPNGPAAAPSVPLARRQAFADAATAAIGVRSSPAWVGPKSLAAASIGKVRPFVGPAAMMGRIVGLGGTGFSRGRSLGVDVNQGDVPDREHIKSDRRRHMHEQPTTEQALEGIV